MFDRRDFLKTFVAGSASLVVLRELSAAPAPGGFAPARSIDYADEPWAQVSQILARIKAPVFPNRDFNVRKFGASGNGKIDCTEAFAKAIAACNRAGGGRVLVPSGEFLTGAIHLKSNINLHLAKDATIKFSQDPRKYLPNVF